MAKKASFGGFEIKIIIASKEPWNITGKISREVCRIINEIVQKGETRQGHAKN